MSNLSFRPIDEHQFQISLYKYPTGGLEGVSVSKAIKAYARLLARSAYF